MNLSLVWVSFFLQGLTNPNYVSVAEAVLDEGSDVDSVSSLIPSLETVASAPPANLRRGLDQGKCLPTSEIHSARTESPNSASVGQIELQGRGGSRSLCQSNLNNHLTPHWVRSTRQVKSFGMWQPLQFVRTAAHCI